MTLSSWKSRSLRDKPACKKASVTSNTQSNPTISIEKLSKFKKTALRMGTWFRALSGLERSIIDLTIKYVDTIRSTKLANLVTAITEKLQTAIERNTDRLVRTIGLPLARKTSVIALRLGNLSAAAWAEDLAFAKYLTLGFFKTS